MPASTTSSRGNGALPTLPTPSPGDATDPTEATVEVAVEREGVLGLSLTQLLGGALAAVTTTVVCAQIGVAGTLFGAAVGSVASAVAAAAYTHSLRRTRTILTPAGRAGARTTRLTAEPIPAPTPVERATTAPRTMAPRTVAPGRGRLAWRRLVLSSAAIFAVVAIVVTGLELGIGRSLDGGSSTTVQQVTSGGGSRDSIVSDTPTQSPTATTPADSGSTSSTTDSPPTSSETSGDTATSDTPTSTETTTDEPSTSTQTPATGTPSTGATSPPTDEDLAAE